MLLHPEEAPYYHMVVLADRQAKGTNISTGRLYQISKHFHAIEQQ